MPPVIDKHTPEPALYGILGDKDAYKQLERHQDPELLSRYPSFHPPSSPANNSEPLEDAFPSDTVKARRSRQRPSVPQTEENEHPSYQASPQQSAATDPLNGGNSWYDKDAEVWKPSKTANKLSRRPLAPSRANLAPSSDYSTLSPPSGIAMSEPTQPFARATKPKKSALKNYPGPPSDVVQQPLQPAPLPSTAYLTPASAARRRAELQRHGHGGPPPAPSSLRPPSHEPPSPYWTSPPASVGRLSSAGGSHRGSHRGSSAATSSVAFTSSSLSNSYSHSNSASYASPHVPDQYGEPDERPARGTLFVVNADPDSASDRSIPVPEISRPPPPAPSLRPPHQRRHQKTMSAPAGAPPVPAVPPQFVAPPPPVFPPPSSSDRSRSAPAVPILSVNQDRTGPRAENPPTANLSHPKSRSHSRPHSKPIPIPPPKTGSSGAGSLTHSDSTSSSSSSRSGSPHTPPNQTSPGTSAEADIPPEWVHPLPLTLEQLFVGGKHEFRITRHMLDGSTRDQKVLVDVQPGWKSGTRITFPGAGNERSPGKFQDVIFVVEQVHHERFARLEGGRLVVTEDIDLPEALNAGRKPRARKIIGLDRKVIEFVPPACVIKNGMETVVKGQGMYLRSKSQVTGRGDLVIRWNVRVPDNLTPAQYNQMREIFTK